MEPHNDEMNSRRQRREELRQKRNREQKRMKLALIAAAVVLVGCVVAMTVLVKDSDKLTAGNPSAAVHETLPPATTKPATEPTQPNAWQAENRTSTIHIKAAGDLNITDSVVASGLAATGFEYTRAFVDVAASLSDADLTVINLEGNICGEPYGSDRTSAPNELLESLRSAGVDLIQMANSCAINNGLIGLRTTLDAIRNAGMEPLGAYASSEEFQRSKGYTITQVDDVKVAFVSFTKGVGGLGLPSGNEDSVNLLYKDYSTTYQEVDSDGIRKILRSISSEEPDITVALLHWGSEYKEEISKTQQSIVSLMQKEGVDVIIGTHPHLVQQIEFDRAAGTLTAYSLGDFYGDGARGGSNYSIILDVEITKDYASGTTRVTGYDFEPVYTMKETDCVDGDRRVVRIREAMHAYENNFVDAVTKSCYDDMVYSLSRIEARVKGE